MFIIVMGWSGQSHLMVEFVNSKESKSGYLDFDLSMNLQYRWCNVPTVVK